MPTNAPHGGECEVEQQLVPKAGKLVGCPGSARDEILTEDTHGPISAMGRNASVVDDRSPYNPPTCSRQEIRTKIGPLKRLSFFGAEFWCKINL
jgi:hypothetical protein